MDIIHAVFVIMNTDPMYTKMNQHSFIIYPAIIKTV